MARRLFRGKPFSENGWPYVDQGSCTWVRIPGAEHVSLQIQNGPPLAILRAFAADYHAYVEPLRDADSACWTPDNSVSTSNHPGGTSMDLNWNGPDGRTFRYGISKGRAFPGAMARALDELYDFYEDIVFCGGEWSIQDWMHHQLRAGTYRSDNNTGWDGGPEPRVLDFIARKIRADGFSTYKRSGPPAPPPPPVVDAAAVLAQATGLTADRAREILPAVRDGLAQSQCVNANRIAMWLAQIGHESGSFKYTEEIAKNGRYAPYIGRTWIQITWESNYRAFSQWCFGKGLVPTNDYFVVHYQELADLKWAGIGPAWYWTVARPKINAQADARDLVAVTQAINGGQNGAADRKQRYDRALALGDQLLALANPVEGEDELSAEAERKIDALYNAFIPDVDSLSSLRPLNGKSPGNVAKLIRYTDASAHLMLSKLLLALDHPETVATVNELAAASPLQYPDRAKDIKLAQVLLKAVAAERQQPAQPQIVNNATAPVVDNSQALSDAYAEISRLQAENAALRAQVQNAPSMELAAVEAAPEPATTSGVVAGKVVDSLEDWTERVLSMDVKQRASLTKSLEALQLPNGTQP